MKLLKTQNLTLKTKVNKLDEKIPNAFTLNHIIQYNTDKQNLKEKIGDLDKKTPQVISLVITNVPNIKIKEGDNKIADLKSLVNKEITTLKYQKLRENTSLLLIIINLRVKNMMQR